MNHFIKKKNISSEISSDRQTIYKILQTLNKKNRVSSTLFDHPLILPPLENTIEHNLFNTNKQVEVTLYTHICNFLTTQYIQIMFIYHEK